MTHNFVKFRAPVCVWIVTKYFVKILLWLTIELCGLHTELIFITNKNALDQTKLCQL